MRIRWKNWKVALKIICYVSIAVFCSIHAVQVYQKRARQAEFDALSEFNTYFTCLTFNGRMGNHMFQYASIYAISKLNNKTVILGREDDLVQYFEVPSAYIRDNRDVCQFFERHFAKRCCHYEEHVTKLEKDKHYLLGEYLQSWKYFRHAIDEVRKELQFRKPYRDIARSVVEQFRTIHTKKASIPATIVGVHLRRGDYASKVNIEDDNMLLTPDQYIYTAMDYFLKHFSNVVFVLCSDDVNYARSIISSKRITAEVVHLAPLQDLAILAACDHVLTTVGSFSWFAGFLSGGNVTYWKHPMREGTFSRTEINYDDFFMPNWIGLGNPLPTRMPKKRSRHFLSFIWNW